MTQSRRSRGSPDRAIEDINAAMARLAKRKPERTDGKLTATNLATEAGMSRKQLYHYFNNAPALAEKWRQLTTERSASRADDSASALRRRVRELEQDLDTWKEIAIAARAETERQKDLNQSLLADNQHLRAALRSEQRVAPLRAH